VGSRSLHKPNVSHCLLGERVFGFGSVDLLLKIFWVGVVQLLRLLRLISSSTTSLTLLWNWEKSFTSSVTMKRFILNFLTMKANRRNGLRIINSTIMGIPQIKKKNIRMFWSSIFTSPKFYNSNDFKHSWHRSLVLSSVSYHVNSSGFNSFPHHSHLSNSFPQKGHLIILAT